MDEDLKKLLEDQAKTTNERFKAMEDLNKKLTEGMTNLAEVVTGLGEGLKSSPKPKDSDPDDMYSSRTLETLSRAELVDHMLKKVEKLLDAKVTPLSKDIDKVDKGTRLKDLQRQIEKLESRHPDFMDWREDIAEIAKNNPNISPQDAYDLARLRNPDRAKELDEKYKPADVKEAEKKAAEAKKKSPFGGLLPTSGKRAEAKTNLDEDKAAELAWQETFGTDGDILSGDEKIE